MNEQEVMNEIIAQKKWQSDVLITLQGIENLLKIAIPVVEVKNDG